MDRNNNTSPNKAYTSKDALAANGAIGAVHGVDE